MYLSNIVTQPGETDGFTVGDHVKLLNKYLDKKKFWRQRNVLLIKNGQKAKEIHEIIRQKTKGNTSIEYLIEAGVIEKKISLSCAIAAQLMWNSSREFNDIIYEAGLMADVDF